MSTGPFDHTTGNLQGTSPGVGQITSTGHPRPLQGFWGTCVVFTGQAQLAGPVIAPPPARP